MDTKEKTVEESPEALLKQGQQTVEALQSKIQRGTAQLDGWKVQLDAQQSYNDKLEAGLGSSKKGRKKKKAAAKKAAAKTTAKVAAKAAKPAKKAPKKAKAAPATKAAPAAKPAKTLAKKAGKKKAAKATAAPAKKGQKVSARKAVASGDLPSLTNRLIEVMGKDDVGIPEVITRLAQKGWTPDSKDLPTYISYMLSSNKETFERVSRGVYRVSKSATNGKGPKGAKGKVSPAKTNGVASKRKKAAAAAAAPAPAAPEPAPSQAEQELAELGATDGSVPSNPFAL